MPSHSESGKETPSYTGSNSVVELIKRDSGTQFDPEVVRAFLELMAEEEKEPTDQLKEEPSTAKETSETVLP